MLQPWLPDTGLNLDLVSKNHSNLHIPYKTFQTPSNVDTQIVSYFYRVWTGNCFLCTVH